MHHKVRAAIQYTKQQTRLLLAVMVASAAGALGGAVVMASIPDASGIIHACYRNTALQKTFRVLDTATGTCNANETELTWNQQGPAGPPGPSDNMNGRYLSVNWGEIPEGGTPQLLYAEPGFGEVYVTMCDSVGEFDYEFRNTSGQTLHTESVYELAPGGTINRSQYGGGVSSIAKGEGSTSQVTLLHIVGYPRQDNETCEFYGGAY